MLRNTLGTWWEHIENNKNPTPHSSSWPVPHTHLSQPWMITTELYGFSWFGNKPFWHLKITHITYLSIYNKHHLLRYNKMNETTKFATRMCHQLARVNQHPHQYPVLQHFWVRLLYSHVKPQKKMDTTCSALPVVVECVAVSTRYTLEKRTVFCNLFYLIKHVVYN